MMMMVMMMMIQKNIVQRKKPTNKKNAELYDGMVLIQKNCNRKEKKKRIMKGGAGGKYRKDRNAACASSWPLTNEGAARREPGGDEESEGDTKKD